MKLLRNLLLVLVPLGFGLLGWQFGKKSQPLYFPSDRECVELRIRKLGGGLDRYGASLPDFPVDLVFDDLATKNLSAEKFEVVATYRFQGSPNEEALRKLRGEGELGAGNLTAWATDYFGREAKVECLVSVDGVTIRGEGERRATSIDE